MASTSSALNMYSNSGFYGAPVTKFLVGTLALGHVALQVPSLSHLQRHLICKVPDFLSQGDWLRFFTTKLAFLDTKDAIFCVLLLYYFRIFERRLGSRKFFSQLSAQFLLTGLIELVLSLGLNELGYPGRHLFLGPAGITLPWIVFYFFDVPSLSSSTFGGVPVSSKSMVYIVALQIAASSQPHFVGSLSAILSAFLYRINFLWLKSWFIVPRLVAKFTHCFIGWLIESAPPQEGMIGATLEIQRTQQMEALEQQMIQQQVLQAARFQRAHRADDRWRPMQNFGGPAAAQPPVQRRPQVEPSEENIRLLTEMGFSVERARNALREANNDLQLATTVLLRDI